MELFPEIVSVILALIMMYFWPIILFILYVVIVYEEIMNGKKHVQNYFLINNIETSKENPNEH